MEARFDSVVMEDWLGSAMLGFYWLGVDMGLELILFGMDEVWDLGDTKDFYGFCMGKE